MMRVLGTVGGNGKMGVDFVLLIDCTLGYKVANKGGEARPPIVAFYKGLSAKAACVAGGGGFMQSCEDGVANGGRDI